MNETIEEKDFETLYYEQSALLKKEKEKVSVLEQRVAVYEQNGIAKLYYSLQRKTNEMADLLNATSLKNLALDDNKDKTFERLKIIWSDASSLSAAVKALGESAGVTGNEHKDVNKKGSFLDNI